MSRHYQAYLIRFQRDDANSYWRVTIENVESGEVLHFATEWKLLRFLVQTLATTPTATPTITDPTITNSTVANRYTVQSMNRHR